MQLRLWNPYSSIVRDSPKPFGPKSVGRSSFRTGEARYRVSAGRTAPGMNGVVQFQAFASYESRSCAGKPSRVAAPSCPPDHPRGLVQYFQDMFPLCFGKGASSNCRRLFRHLFQFRQRWTQRGTRRKDYSAFDDILQFTNVAGPVVRLRISITSPGIESMGLLRRAESFFTKYSTNSGMSWARSRSGGRKIGITFNR